MSEVTDTVPAMTEIELKPSDHVYGGIRSLAGWDRTLEGAYGHGGQRARHVGVLISDVLLAGGEGRMPVAIAGKLDKTGTGHLAVLHSDVLVIAAARNLTSSDTSTMVTVRSLRELTNVEVHGHHNYFDGTERRQRDDDLQVTVTLDRLMITFQDRGYQRTPLTDATAVNAALDTIRAALAR